MSRSKRILVIGAGELGTQVLLSLAHHPRRDNAAIAVLLRPSSITSTNSPKVQRLQALRTSDIQLVPADIANDTQESLSAIFHKYDTVISCTGFSAGPGTQLKLTRAVLAAEVQRYIPWQFGVDYDSIGRGSAQDLFDKQLDVRDLLRSQRKTKWAVISTGMFTSFLFEPSFGVVDFEKDTVLALGSLNTRVTVTAPEDIGRITAEAVLGPHVDEVFCNQPVYVAGDTLSYGQLADLVERMAGRRFTRLVRTLEAAREDLAKEPGNPLFKYQVVFGEGKGVAWDVRETWNHRHGMHAMTAEDWARAHLRWGG